MRKLVTTIGVLLITLGVMLHAQKINAETPPEENALPVLAPCTRHTEDIGEAGFTDRKFQEWPDHYHNTVNEVIEEFLSTPKIECMKESYEEVVQPGEKMTELARALPPWRDEETKLYYNDIGLVLLEYLRVYECALEEHRLWNWWGQEVREEKTETLGVVEGWIKNFTYDLLGAEVGVQIAAAENQLTIARPTMERALQYISGLNRMRPMETELRCVQGVSLDLRNLTALSAEASSCLPRMWNAKDPLRDIMSEEN